MPKVIASVKAIIHHNQTYLVIKERIYNNSIVYDLPGGKIEYGESVAEALFREIKEELCIDVIIEKLLGVWHFFVEGTGDQVVCITFLCRPKSGSVIDLTKNPAPEEIVEYEWMTKQQLLNLPLEKSLKEIIANLSE